jgi:hypothetical protein
MSSWLDDINSTTNAARFQAAEAVHQIGPAGVPFLISLLAQDDDPQWKVKLITLANRQHIVKLHFVLGEARRFQALTACSALGPGAKDALPALEKLLHKPSESLAAALVLADIGPAAEPILARSLTNEFGATRFECRAALQMLRNSKRTFPDGEDFELDFPERLFRFQLKAAPMFDLVRPFER